MHGHKIKQALPLPIKTKTKRKASLNCWTFIGGNPIN